MLITVLIMGLIILAIVTMLVVSDAMAGERHARLQRELGAAVIEQTPRIQL